MAKAITTSAATIGSELQALDFFVGHWRAEGTSFAAETPGDDPRLTGVPWMSDESFVWLPGGFFLMHRWHEHGSDQSFVGTELLGFDPAEGGYFSQMFDNRGHHPRFRIHHTENIWTFDATGLRAIATVRSHDMVAFNWEWKFNDAVWLPLCDRIARRVG